MLLGELLIKKSEWIYSKVYEYGIFIVFIFINNNLFSNLNKKRLNFSKYLCI